MVSLTVHYPLWYHVSTHGCFSHNVDNDAYWGVFGVLNQNCGQTAPLTVSYYSNNIIGAQYLILLSFEVFLFIFFHVKSLLTSSCSN